MRLVLASASPRRAELLQAAGFVFEVLGVDLDEHVRDGEAAGDYVQRLANEKAARAQTLIRPAPGASGVSRMEPVILAADTAVVIEGDILGKPEDDDDATAMLRRLSGRRHQVMTGVCIRAGRRELHRVDVTAVAFGVMSAEDIAWYVRSGEGRDKAGGYGIQGMAARFIPRIEGSYSNVVGLPIATVHELISEIASGL